MTERMHTSSFMHRDAASVACAVLALLCFSVSLATVRADPFAAGPDGAGAGADPFHSAALERFEQIFIAENLTIRLRQREGGLKGQFTYKGITYPTTAVLDAGQLRGKCESKKGPWSYVIDVTDDGGFVLETSSSRIPLTTKEFTWDSREWQSEEVTLSTVRGKGNGMAGTLQFRGAQLKWRGSTELDRLTGTAAATGKTPITFTFTQDHQGKRGTFRASDVVVALTSEPTTLELDLGEGVIMEFVYVKALKGWVGKYEVTNGQFRRYVASHSSGETRGHSLDGGRQPVVKVSFNGQRSAIDFCGWLNATRREQIPEGHRARLPTGQEWGTFAQCGDDREYPWGNEWPPPEGAGNFYDETARETFKPTEPPTGYRDGSAVTVEVERSGRNDWGIYGIAGNVWEWTSQQPSNNRRVIRGLSCFHALTKEDAKCLCLQWGNKPTQRDKSCGFRVVVMPVR